MVIPAAVVLSHPEQLVRLRESSPEAAEVAVLAGDPCIDRMLASRPLRATYRRALGVRNAERLVLVSSTWGASSLFGVDPELVPRLAARLPLDEYRVVLALHPNIWFRHSPWQVRMWLDDCRRAGVRVLPPEEGWQAALVAADVVLGDHGSVTFYGAALGHPVLLASTPHETVDPRSPIAMLLQAVPRLDSGVDLVQQLEATIADHDHAGLRQITDLATSSPGDAAALLRSTIYRMLNLPEPSAPAEFRAVPVPPSEPASVGAQLVEVRLTSTSETNVRCDVSRFPADLLRTRDSAPAGAHLSVDTSEPYRNWLELADIMVLPTAADITPVLATMPGCLLATAPVGAGEWVVKLHDGRGIRFRSVTIDGRICASIVYTWLSAGKRLESFPQQLSVWTGFTLSTLEAILE